MGKKRLKLPELKKKFPRAKSANPIPFTYRLPEAEYYEDKPFYRCESIYSSRAYKYYRVHKKRKRVFSKMGFVRIMKLFFKALKKAICDNEAGVFIEKFGYFCVMHSPQRRVKEYGTFIGKYIHSLGIRHTPVFIPIRKDSAMRHWCLEFPVAIQKRVDRRVAKGRKYECIYSVLQNLYGRENVKVYPPNPIQN